MAFHDGDLDSDTANRLLTGRLEPDDAPPGYRKVAQLLQDARSGNGLPEVTDDAVILAVVDAITHPDELARKRKHMLTRIVTTKVANRHSCRRAERHRRRRRDRVVARYGAERSREDAAAHIGINLPDTRTTRHVTRHSPTRTTPTTTPPTRRGMPPPTSKTRPPTRTRPKTTRLPATRRKPCRPRQRRATRRTTAASSRRPRGRSRPERRQG